MLGDSSSGRCLTLRSGRRLLHPMGVAFFRSSRTAEGAGMLVELRVAEQRYRAVWEVLEGASVTEVARRFRVSRQSVHAWLRRYAADGGLGGLGDRSSRPHGCPHQMSAVTEAKIVEVRRSHPAWGADRIRYQLIMEDLPAPGRTSIYRALIRNGLVVPGQRRRRRKRPPRRAPAPG